MEKVFNESKNNKYFKNTIDGDEKYKLKESNIKIAFTYGKPLNAEDLKLPDYE